MLNLCFCLFNAGNSSSVIRTKLSLQNLSFNKKPTNFLANTTLITFKQIHKKYQFSLYFPNSTIKTSDKTKTPVTTKFNSVYMASIIDNWRFLNFLPPVLTTNVLKNTISLFIYSRDVLEKRNQRRLVNSFLNHSLTSYRRILTSLSMAWFVNLYFIGVGYKIFVYNDYLYIRLGFSRMIKIKIPSSIYILTRYRNNIKLISSDLSLLNIFVNQLLLLRIFNPYKGKGIYQLSDFSDIKLKVGKKQQFF